MFLELPLPDSRELKALIVKARKAENFTAQELLLVVNVLQTLHDDPMYRLQERMKSYERKDKS